MNKNSSSIIKKIFTLISLIWLSIDLVAIGMAIKPFAIARHGGFISYGVSSSIDILMIGELSATARLRRCWESCLSLRGRQLRAPQLHIHVQCLLVPLM
jgi:hypothetical protein